MYTPEHFAETDPDTIAAFIHENAFGMLVSVTDTRPQITPQVTHLPFLYAQEQQTLTAHLARENPQWRSLHAKPEVMVVLPGPHAYVSPTWYGKPGVPTWNYAAVHIHGIAEVYDDPDALHNTVAALSAKFEAANPTPWDGEYNARMLERIVGIRIRITRVEATFKLSQNKARADRQSVASQLRKPALSEAQRLAAMMNAHDS